MFIDAHCDTASVLCDSKKLLNKNDLHFDLDRCPIGHTQVFAAYIDPLYYDNPMKRLETIVEDFKKQVENQSERITICKNNDERLKALSEGKVAAFLSVEDACMLHTIEDVEKIHSMGVKFVSLTWNNDNHLAGGVLGDEESSLTNQGRRIIYELNKRGIIIDVSHLSNQSFWEVVRVTNYPIIASHSCSKKICNNKRNLTDEQFLAICQRGGVVGINFYPKFLVSRGKAQINHIIKHIDHFLQLGGENHIGLGSDFDGIESLPGGIGGVEDMEKLICAFKEHSYTDELINKICYGNFERILRLL